ncbi:unnamed protein product, partial [Lepidochelys olivacea]
MEVWLLCLWIPLTQAVEETLLNTRLETSDLKWTTYPQTDGQVRGLAGSGGRWREGGWGEGCDIVGCGQVWGGMWRNRGAGCLATQLTELCPHPCALPPVSSPCTPSAHLSLPPGLDPLISPCTPSPNHLLSAPVSSPCTPSPN